MTFSFVPLAGYETSLLSKKVEFLVMGSWCLSGHCVSEQVILLHFKAIYLSKALTCINFFLF